MSVDSASHSSLTDFASMKSLSYRIRRNQSLASVNAQEYARIKPSKVMRPASVASSDLGLFDSVSKISFVEAESDMMSL